MSPACAGREVAAPWGPLGEGGPAPGVEREEVDAQVREAGAEPGVGRRNTAICHHLTLEQVAIGICIEFQRRRSGPGQLHCHLHGPASSALPPPLASTFPRAFHAPGSGDSSSLALCPCRSPTAGSGYGPGVGAGGARSLAAVCPPGRHTTCPPPLAGTPAAALGTW